jgi:hypothetical protein
MGVAGDVLSALLGLSAYERPHDPRECEAADARRAALGPSISRQTSPQLRWYLSDLEDAMIAADAGRLRGAARLWRAMRCDGVIAGLLSTCTDGLVRLPHSFAGSDEQVDRLRGNRTFSVFDSMLPASELALLAADGRGLGVAIGELVPVRGRDYPVLVRLEPEWLRYSWPDARWYYTTTAGDLPVTPGDGRWVLHVPGGRVAPWQHGLWYALGEAWIPKTHAKSYRSNWESKLANPARVAVSPSASTDEQSEAWFQRVMAWGVNTVFGLRPGYDVKLLESNGRGHEAFASTIATSNEEIIIALAGQLVTTTGGTGFANADIHKSIRADIIKAIADSLAHTINTQAIPPWVVARWGVAALDGRAMVSWDVSPPKDRAAEGQALSAFAQGVTALRAALAPYGRDVDMPALLASHGLSTVALGAVSASGYGDSTEPRGESDPDGNGVPGEPPTAASAQALADKMTAEGVDRCEHGSSNRCRLCGVERERDFDRDESGAIVWRIAWRPIA